MKKRMPHILHLAALLFIGCLCSCIRTHGVLYETPRSYEGLWMPNNSEAQEHNTADMKVTTKLYLYEADGSWYLPVRLVRYEQKPNVLGGWRNPPFERTVETSRAPQTYYLPIPTATAQRLLTPQRSALAPQRLAQGTDTAALLSSLPPHARAHLIRCPVRDFGQEEGGIITRTATHISPSALLAYPAAGLLAIGVDLPLSLLGTTLSAAAAAPYVLICPSAVFR